LLVHVSSIGSENGLNMYLNSRVHGSIPTEDKNYTKEGGGEDHEVAVAGPPKLVGPELLHDHLKITHSDTPKSIY
jgi:hypothetical protein